MESTSTSSSAVEAARTEAHRRHRLREMAERPAVQFDQDGAELLVHGSSTAAHLRAAAQGELLDREPGHEPFDQHGIMPDVVALDHETAQKMASKPR